MAEVVSVVALSFTILACSLGEPADGEEKCANGLPRVATTMNVLREGPEGRFLFDIDRNGVLQFAMRENGEIETSAGFTVGEVGELFWRGMAEKLRVSGSEMGACFAQALVKRDSGP